MVTDAFLSYESLLGARKPLGAWYIAFALNNTSLWLLSVIIKATNKKIRNKCSCVMEFFQFFLWISTIFFVIIGYHWLICSWWSTSELIPWRLKIELSVILLIYTFFLLPAISISLFTVIRIVIYANMIRSKSKMRNLLEEIHYKMYNPKFEIKDY